MDFLGGTFDDLAKCAVNGRIVDQVVIINYQNAILGYGGQFIKYQSNEIILRRRHG